jgi:ligand-binding sensor domain-containing protein/putative methionine-R-sulfoxide reductase with GAF domain
LLLGFRFWLQFKRPGSAIKNLKPKIKNIHRALFQSSVRCFLPAACKLNTLLLTVGSNIYILKHQLLAVMHRLFILLLVSSLSVASVSGQYLFENLKPKDGLSSREVRALYQDSEGFMWMGGMNGLNRFDGNHFLVWGRTSPTYPATLGETVSAITEYDKGKIWFGTNTGVGILDKTNRQFSEVEIKPAGTRSKRPYIMQFQQDKEGHLWMGTSNGVYVYRDGAFKPASSLYPFAGELDSVSCYHSGFIYDTVRNLFWMASPRGLFCLDPVKKQLFSSKNNPDSLPIYTTQLLNSVAINKAGDLWMGNVSDNSIWHYELSNGKLEKITRINDNPLWVMTSGANNLFFDAKGRLWISTWLFTSFIRQTDGRFEVIPYNENVPYSIGYGLVNDAMQDSYGNIWLATINGVSKLPSSGFVENIVKTPTYPFFFTINFSNVNGMTTTPDHVWWMAKMEGLVKYDSVTRQFERFAPFKDGDRWNEMGDVEVIDNEVWCATGNGLYILNPVTKKMRLFPYLPNVKGVTRGIGWIHPDSQGYIWISVWHDGVYRYDSRTHECIRLNDHPDQWNDFSTVYSNSILETSDKKIWLSNGRKGLCVIDQASRPSKWNGDSTLKKVDIVSMVEDRNHAVWISTRQSGLFKYDLTGRLLDSITVKDGLPGNGYFDLCIDASGRLWTTSRESLLSIQLSTKQVTRVNLDVTFSFNDHWNSLLLKNNMLYATMLDNVVVINPDKLEHDFSTTAPLISGFRVFEKDIPFNSVEDIRLAYTQNFFSIDFSSPFHREDASIQYAYKLEKFDKDWVYCGRRQTAAYTNVPEGNYRFMVKTSTGNGEWSEQTKTIRIVIQPPFWKTWWFILLLVMAIIALAIWFWQIRKRREGKKQMEKTIDYFANSVYGENSVNEICWDIARNCISQLHFEDCVVYLLDEKTGYLIQKAAYGPKNPKGHEIVDPIEIEKGKGIVGTVAETGKPLLIADTTNDSRYLVDDQHRFSELAVPILHDGKVIGVIDSENSQKNFFTQDHLKTMSTIASISANKIAEAQAEEYARENEIKILEINKMLAESQLMALRAQMNPHFVFNCLNSIQECIVTEKYGEASKYLNKFSKLFRTVLNNSGRNLVSINEEKEVLELYLELEQMRFEKSFSYEMIVDEELETDEILIPSMLLQPYVENALWHGLMHKEGERKLFIRFERLNEEIFRCTIDDNGIGRKRSFELKAQQSKAKRHESKGLKISKDRIDVLQKQGYHATLDMTDKYDERGEATGTTITIELSTFLKM